MHFLLFSVFHLYENSSKSHCPLYNGTQVLYTFHLQLSPKYVSTLSSQYIM